MHTRVQRKLAVGHAVDREVHRLFEGNNSLFFAGGLGDQLPKLPGALVRVISGRQWPGNGSPPDTFSINAHPIYTHSRTLAQWGVVLPLDGRSGHVAVGFRSRHASTHRRCYAAVAPLAIA